MGHDDGWVEDISAMVIVFLMLLFVGLAGLAAYFWWGAV